jgi:anti-anti-sigma factor
MSPRWRPSVPRGRGPAGGRNRRHRRTVLAAEAFGASLPPGQLDLDVAIGPDRVITVTVAGEIDLSVADGFQEVLVGAWEELGLDVAVDLGEVAFFDAAALRAVLAAHARVVAEGGTLRVVRPSASVRRVLDVTGTAAQLGVDA